MKGMRIEDGVVVLSVNPWLYPIEVVYSAAYVFLDKAYIRLEGDPKSEIIVRIKPKKDTDLDKMGGEFLNELINYADYRERAKETKAIREALLQRALITNDPGIISSQASAEDDAEFEKLLKELEDEDEDYLDDPEGIAIPWEEKYGKKAKDKDEKDNNTQ